MKKYFLNNTLILIIGLGTSFLHFLNAQPNLYGENKEKIENNVFYDSDNKFGIVNKNGEIIIPATHLYLNNSNEHYFYGNVEGKGHVEYWLDEKQKKLIELAPDIEFLGTMNELAWFFNRKTDKEGMLNNQNEVVIPFEYDGIENNKNFWFAYNEDKESKRKPIILNSNYEVLPENNYIDHRLSPFENIVAVRNNNNKWGFLDGDLKEITSFIYDSFRFANENLTLVTKKITDYVSYSGYIDNNGKEVIPLKYEYLSDKIFNDLIIFKENNKYGYLNVLGDISIKPQYYQCNNFNKGFAFVIIDNYNYGVIDTKGNFTMKGKKSEHSSVDINLINKENTYTIMNKTYDYKGNLIKI
jgi:hypothetical protein